MSYIVQCSTYHSRQYDCDKDLRLRKKFDENITSGIKTEEIHKST